VATPQDPRPIPEEPACRACEIVIGPRRLTVSDPSPVTGTTLDAFITVLASGQYLAGSASAPPQLFDASGRLSSWAAAA
jgi:hypothetical protein